MKKAKDKQEYDSMLFAYIEKELGLDKKSKIKKSTSKKAVTNEKR